MSEEFLKRIRIAAEQAKENKNQEEIKRNEKENKQKSHYEKFKNIIDSEIEPALQKIALELDKLNYSSKIIQDLRETHGGHYNYNIIKFIFSEEKLDTNSINTSELKIVRNPENGSIEFRKTIRKPTTTIENLIKKVSIDDINQDLILDIASNVVAEAIN